MQRNCLEIFENFGILFGHVTNFEKSLEHDKKFVFFNFDKPDFRPPKNLELAPVMSDFRKELTAHELPFLPGNNFSDPSKER